MVARFLIPNVQGHYDLKNYVRETPKVKQRDGMYHTLIVLRCHGNDMTVYMGVYFLLIYGCC